MRQVRGYSCFARVGKCLQDQFTNPAIDLSPLTFFGFMFLSALIYARILSEIFEPFSFKKKPKISISRMKKAHLENLSLMLTKVLRQKIVSKISNMSLSVVAAVARSSMTA